MAQHFQSVDDVKRHFGALKSEEAEKVLTPREASPESILQAATLTEEHIIKASDVARSMGEAGEDACLVLLRASIERDLDQATYHIAAFDEEWELALAVLAEAAQSPDLDEEQVVARFDAMVPQSATAILGGEQSDLNVNSLIS